MILLQEINVRDNKWLIVGLNVAAFLSVFPFYLFLSLDLQSDNWQSRDSF